MQPPASSAGSSRPQPFPAHDSSPPSVPRPRTRGVKASLTPRRRKRATENDEYDEYAAFARRVLRAWARRVAAGDIDAVAGMAAAQRELDDALRQAVAGLRRKGYSWSEIGTRLGVTKQAAQQRWGPGRQPALPPGGVNAHSADEERAG